MLILNNGAIVVILSCSLVVMVFFFLFFLFFAWNRLMQGTLLHLQFMEWMVSNLEKSSSQWKFLVPIRNTFSSWMHDVNVVILCRIWIWIREQTIHARSSMRSTSDRFHSWLFEAVRFSDHLRVLWTTTYLKCYQLHLIPSYGYSHMLVARNTCDQAYSHHQLSYAQKHLWSCRHSNLWANYLAISTRWPNQL